MREETGLEPLLLLTDAKALDYYEKLNGGPLDFESIVIKDPYDVLEEPAPDVSTAEILARARRAEKALGLGLYRDYVLQDRHMGRGYLLAGSGHPSSVLADLSDQRRIAHAFAEQAEWTAELFERYPPAMICSYYGGGGVRQKMMATGARHRGVPFRALCPARLGGLVYWADDEFEGSEALSGYLAQPGPQLSEEEIAAETGGLRSSALATNAAALSSRAASRRWSQIVKQSAWLTARYFYWRFKGYAKARRGYKLSDTIRWLVRQRRHYRLLDKIALRDLKDLPDGVKIVYFPLQQEPEASTLALAPENTNQLATVMELSLTIPADAILMVKEHTWQVGRRPNDFYDRLLGMHNVRLVHPDLPGLAVCRRADLVATITSSAGYEAAVLGKPTLFFWSHCPIASTPHVHKAPRLEGIERVLDLLDDCDGDAKRRREHDGAALARRLREFCIDAEEMEFFTRKEPAPREDVARLAAPLTHELTTAQTDLRVGA
ncbi:MAG: hypothetical protein RIB45_10235 [Marivibrio sp.]|uniref:hypothetical protein n=1 Tax=Marivibrio sp. TaxID=2039719 RepID=UPI0032EC02B7